MLWFFYVSNVKPKKNAYGIKKNRELQLRFFRAIFAYNHIFNNKNFNNEIFNE